MTDEEIATIEARANAAYPPPWRAGTVDAQGKVWAFDPGALGGPSMGERCLFNANTHYDHTANREFIAAARTDVPALVAEVRHARASLAVSEAMLADLATFLGIDADAMGATVRAAAEARDEATRQAERERCAVECGRHANVCRARAAREALRGNDGSHASWEMSAVGADSCARRLRAIPSAAVEAAWLTTEGGER